MSNQQHNSDKYSITWGLLPMLDGLAKGNMVSDSGITGGWVWRGDANGGGVYSYDPDHSGILTFNVEESHLLHQQLLALWNVDRGTRNVFNDITIKNNDTKEKRVFHNARPQKPPPFALNTESAIVPWVFPYTGLTYAPDLGGANILGSGVTPTLPGA